MQRRGMEEDFSWKESGRKYSVMYRALLDGNIEKLGEIFEAERVKKAAADAKKQAVQHKKNARASVAMAQKIVEEASNYEFVDISNSSDEDW